MGLFDTIKNAAKDMGDAVVDGARGAEKAAVDGFQGAVTGVKTAAGAVVQAGVTVVHGAGLASHDAAAAVQQHDLVGGIARVHQDLAGGAGTALSQAWDGAGRAAGQVAQGAHQAAADSGTGIGHAYDKASGAATHLATAVAGKQVGAAVGRLTHGVGAAGRALADGSLAAVTALGGDVGSMVHGTGDLAIGVARVGTDAAYRHKALEKFKGTALAIGDMELAAIRDPAGAKAKLEQAVKGKVERFDQDGLTAMQDGKLPDFVGGAVGHVAAIVLTTAAPEGKAAAEAEAAGRLTEGAIDAERGVDAAEEVGEGSGVGHAGAGRRPPEPPTKPTGQPAPEPDDAPRSGAPEVAGSGQGAPRERTVGSDQPRGPRGRLVKPPTPEEVEAAKQDAARIAARTKFVETVVRGPGVTDLIATRAIDAFTARCSPSFATEFLDGYRGRIAFDKAGAGGVNTRLLAASDAAKAEAATRRLEVPPNPQVFDATAAAKLRESHARFLDNTLCGPGVNARMAENAVKRFVRGADFSSATEFFDNFRGRLVIETGKGGEKASSAIKVSIADPGSTPAGLTPYTDLPVVTRPLPFKRGAPEARAPQAPDDVGRSGPHETPGTTPRPGSADPGEGSRRLRADNLAKLLTRAGGTATEDDLHVVRNELANAVPHSVLTSLDDAGVQIVVTRHSVLEHVPELTGVPVSMKDPLRTYADVSAAFFRPKLVVLSTQAGVSGAREISRTDMLETIGRAVNENSFGSSYNLTLCDNNLFWGALFSPEMRDFSERIIDTIPEFTSFEDPLHNPALNEMFAQLFAIYADHPAALEAKFPEMYDAMQAALRIDPNDP